MDEGNIGRRRLKRMSEKPLRVIEEFYEDEDEEDYEPQ